MGAIKLAPDNRHVPCFPTTCPARPNTGIQLPSTAPFPQRGLAVYLHFRSAYQAPKDSVRQTVTICLQVKWL